MRSPRAGTPGHSAYGQQNHGARRRWHPVRLLLEVMLIGVSCGLVAAALHGRSEEHRNDGARSKLDVESTQRGEVQGRGSDGGHALNSSAEGGCCA